ncbi:aldo/keto reductase [Thermosynechococcus sp. PKX91]|uniref:aldo/keto reductase n=2 Tax=Thermosynechococcus TaxID=146785 RepID=UPI0028738739|nr:aldo/keto reductase [Thermosynechococcus sp. PKX91]WNC35179.1 aldo/keto reductase [Thermosynechococcus sp. PKX91]
MGNKHPKKRSAGSLFSQVGMNTQRLALGTVQFGLAYGIANQQGQVTLEEAKAILQQAQEVGIDTLDTAIAYGDSEARLGDIGVQSWNVVTKLPKLPSNLSNVQQWVQDNCRRSLQRLKLDKLYGLLLHHPLDLLRSEGKELYDALLELKKDGWVDKIGFSIYSPQELEQLYPNFKPDLVQAPFNGLDQRLVKSGWLARLKSDGVEVHARSVFLQGLLLMPAEKHPQKFSRWSKLWQAIETWQATVRVTPLQACLGAAFHQQGLDRILVGVESCGQLQAILEAMNTDLPPWPSHLCSDDLDLIHPSRWEQL